MKLFKNVLYHISCISGSIIRYIFFNKFSPLSVHEIVLFELNVRYNFMHTKNNFEYVFPGSQAVISLEMTELKNETQN